MVPVGIGAALRTAAASRKLDADLAERVVFALVGQLALDPGSGLDSRPDEFAVLQ